MAIRRFRRGQRPITANATNGDESTETVKSTPRKPVLYYLEELYNKRGTVRENALSPIIEILNTRSEIEYACLQKNFITFLYRFLNSIKKGSAKETQLASHAIGLLAMTFCDTDNAQELYKESIPELETTLKSGLKTSKILDALAIVSFFCANNVEETELAMQIIWEFILLKSGSAVIASKRSPAILAAAISAWSFLLTTRDGWEFSQKNWKGTISCLLGMLEEDDESVCVAAGEALAMIFEINSLDKFSSEDEGTSDSSALEGTKSPPKYCDKKNLIKDTIVKQLEKLSIRARDKTSVNQTFSEVSNADWGVMKYFQDGNFPEVSVPIERHTLMLSSWSQILQLNFMRHFLGKQDFLKHMLRNELFQNLFEFKPTYNQYSGKELYASTMEKVVVHYYVPEEKDSSRLTRTEKKKDRVLRNSIISKARTQWMSKNRLLSQEMKSSEYEIE
ncbi:Interferon-related developmental regulator [Quillaja saponaria]|uniref:Interferon-related developmental regulator n=1 Tax=Quillaja saponaria TaxID=32244 RepID=A0AAD7KUS6_QUISA|nr:Interferon-related developmental regulator [Quillaja saponaria]